MIFLLKKIQVIKLKLYNFNYNFITICKKKIIQY